jgi:hypothetical protein
MLLLIFTMKVPTEEYVWDFWLIFEVSFSTEPSPQSIYIGVFDDFIDAAYIPVFL